MTEGRSAVSLAGVVAAHDTPPFLPEDIASLLPAGVDLEEVCLTLNSAVGKYAVALRRSTSLGHRGIARQARIIALASRKTLNACGIVGKRTIAPENIYDGLSHGALFAAAALDGAENGGEAVIAALNAVEDLRRWATLLQARSAELAKQRPTPRSGPRPNTEFDVFMASVAGVYRRCFLLNPVIEEPLLKQDEDRKPSGAFFELLRFATSRLADLGLCARVGDDALARRWYRLKGQNKSRNN